jgi:hypothetical protein
LGEIRFGTKGTPKYVTTENKNYIIRIKENGAFELYYQYNLIYPTVLGGRYNIMDSIRDRYAYQTTNAGLIGEIQIAINTINGNLIGLESAVGAIAATVELLNDMTVNDLEIYTYIEQIKQQAIDHLYQFNIKLRSLNDINGNINCNISTQQYIPSFKCDNLNLNYCNINHIGTFKCYTWNFW